jgi:hypothetical protein
MKLMIDSGAFSKFTRGIEIDLGRYISFLHDNRHRIEQYVVLDVIPGEWGIRDADPARIERDARQSYANFQRMKDAGLAPLPVFHRNDHFKWLEKYLADGQQFICLAPLPYQSTAVIPWFDHCFTLIPETVKTHCLGITTLTVLRRYPFVSADSRTWVEVASNGGIYVPLFKRDRPDYSYEPDKIAVTNKSQFKNIHIDLIDGDRREQAERFLHEVGISLAEVRRSKFARMLVNLKYFAGLAVATNTKIFYVTNTDPEQREVLSQCGASTRLLSFADLRGERATALEDYVRSQINRDGVSDHEPA